MQNIRRNRLICSLALGVLLFAAAQPARGLVLHPDGEPNLASWTDRPPEEVVGRWGSYCCCVAISPDCVVTTRHQIIRLTTPVTIGGRDYAVAETWEHETADLRIVRLEGANLSRFAGLYTGGSEVSQRVVITGYGAGRGRALERDGIVYGYEWDGPDSDRLRFGDNRVYHVRENSVMGAIVSDVLIADFDGPDEGGSTPYECTVAARDSGGGWFIKTGRTWKLAGLSRAVDIHFEPGHENDLDYALYAAWFRERENPGALRPDRMDAVRISSYARWISDTIPPAPGDLNGDGRVDLLDFAVFCINWNRSDCTPPDDCLGADFEHDGDVDAADLIQLADMWLVSYAGGNSLLP
jgi:hypothetical protein